MKHFLTFVLIVTMLVTINNCSYHNPVDPSDDSPADTTIVPVEKAFYGTVTHNQDTRLMTLQGNFEKYPWLILMANESVDVPLDTVIITERVTKIYVADIYTHYNFRNEAGSWYNDDLKMITVTGAEWVAKDGAYWPWEKQEADTCPVCPPEVKYWVKIVVNVENANTCCDNQPCDVGILEITAGMHTVSAQKDGYIPIGYTFYAIANDTVLVEICLEKMYKLTVNSGYGDGMYPENNAISIYTDAPLPGYHFIYWAGGGEAISDSTQEETWILMPDHDITVTAMYEKDAQSEYYIHENLYWDENSRSDVFVLKTNVAGTCPKQIRYLILNGSDGPMLAINLFTGRVYKFNPDGTTYYARYDATIVQKDDEFHINLGQPHIQNYLYCRFTYIYGPDIVPSQWHYDGRFGYPEPTLLTNRLVDEENGEWDWGERRTQ